jgi:tetratricopeptide (TPR) repeat protein
LDEALDQLKELQKFDSGDLDIRTKIGLIYMEQEKLDQAILEFSFVLAAHPKDDRVRYYLGAAYVEKEAFDQAISEFKKIPPESTLFSDSRRSIVLILMKQNRIEEALQIMDESIRVKPKDGDLYLILAALFEKENQLPKALDTLKKGLDQNKEDVEIHFQLGAIYDKLGDFDNMVTQMKEALRLNPDHADTLNYLGYSYADRGIHLEEALRLIQKAMILKPNMGYITDSLGWVYFKLGDYEKALIELEKANQLTPDDPTVTEHLADSYLKLNRIEKAIEFYEKAQKLEPKSDQMERLKNKIKELKEKHSK